MSLMVDVAARTQGNVHVSSVVKLIGSLEPATMPEAERVIRPLLAAGPKVLVFDLSELEFITSTGIGLLLGGKAAMERRGGVCFLSSPRPQVRKVLDIMKALPAATVFESQKQLDEYLIDIQRQVAEGDVPST